MDMCPVLKLHFLECQFHGDVPCSKVKKLCNVMFNSVTVEWAYHCKAFVTLYFKVKYNTVIHFV